MIFSGQVRTYRCPECRYEGSQQFSSAIVYWFGLIVLSCVVVLPIMAHRYERHHLWQAMALIAGDAALLAILITGTTYWLNRQPASDLKCPQCSQPLQKTGSGFYDSFLPTAADMFVGLGYFAVHAVMIAKMLNWW
ncbi:MAG: hypothetical protein ABIY70_17595 [Capsulimonas sp.]|uniref:hypothetical protein n=1 Tax=Capsulimonas sp. TaxID=2494211 RepID=UPI0032667A97